MMEKVMRGGVWGHQIQRNKEPLTHPRTCAVQHDIVADPHVVSVVDVEHVPRKSLKIDSNFLKR